jgi:hypothetical protein
MVVGIARDELVAADMVMGEDALDDMHREWQPGHPGPAIALVGQVETGGRCVLNLRLGAEVVDRANEQVRLDAAHQIEVAQWLACIGGQR